MSLAIDMLRRPAPGRSRWLAGVALHAVILGACTFAPAGFDPDTDAMPPPPRDGMRDADPGRDTMDPIDAPPPGPRNVVHVPEAGWEGNTSDATWTGNVTIDTSALSISGPGTEGLTLRTEDHDPAGGPELALLHVGTLTINENVDVRVTGSRPLVIISAEDIVLNGSIEAGAEGQTAGAGGAEPGAGAGAGQEGAHFEGTSNDAGGGGAGHATAGGRGAQGCTERGGFGTSCDDSDAAEGGPAGVAYGEAALETLFGGSGGGRGGEGGNSCPGGPGGAGGGAVQLYALGTITVGSNGGVSVGGGGGQGGDRQDGEDSCAASGGGGGGSGGSVYLQADSIRIDGVIAANGGGGGAASDGLVPGESGDDGALGSTPAAGGADPGDGGSPGGAGAAGRSGPQQGEDQDGEPNGGGGGGAAGRIVFNCNDLEGTGTVSPGFFPATSGCMP